MSPRAGMNPRRLFVVCALASMMLMPALAHAQLRAQPYVPVSASRLRLFPISSRPGRHFVVEQMGHVRVVVDGVLQERDFLDVSSLVTPRTPIEAERGLIGTGSRAGLRDERTFFHRVHPRGHVAGRTGRSDYRALQVRAERTAVCRCRLHASTCDGTVHRAPGFIEHWRGRPTTAVRWCSARTGISTSAWETAGEPAIPTGTHKIRWS